MAVSQSPSTTPTFPATISPPVDGDPLSAPQIRDDDLTPLQNGVEAARLVVRGNVSRRVSCTANNSLVIQPIGAVMTAVGGTTWTVKKHVAPSTIDPSALIALGNTTRYYVYVALIAGTITFSVSTTPPDADWKYMSGDESKLFISTFHTNAAAQIIFYDQTDNEYWFTFRTPNGGGVTGNLILDSGSATGPTTIGYGINVPTGAKLALLSGYITSSANDVVNLYQTGRATASFNTGCAASALTGFDTQMGTSVTNNFQYALTAATADVFIWVSGFKI